MTTSTRSATPVLHRRLCVRGTVQGVGFRPFVHRLATELGLTGSVGNTGQGVIVELWGDVEGLDEFVRRLVADAPPLSRIDAVDVVPSSAPTGPADQPADFRVMTSTVASGRPAVSIPVDVTLCESCRRELFDAADRRYRHPFITCTDCGPRFTITRTLPYDRATTTMAGFEMCPACRAEYDDPADRRFHAQPIGCHDCGPHLVFAGADGQATARRDDALRAAQRAIDRGRIVAVQGTGGHHLICDATNPVAVASLRRRKGRPDKPFAVMVRSIEVIDAVARAGVLALSEAERAALESPRRPIVLLRRTPPPPTADAHEPAAPWLELVAPGVADLGVLLPDTAVHHLLFDGLGTDVVVCTSGNLSEEPIITDPADARARLAEVADGFLQHDRPIHTPCDDSIVRVERSAESADRTVLVRRSRGWTPEPIELPGPTGRPVLAMGGDLKGAVCVSDGRRAWMSQHLGDLGSLGSYRAARAACEQLVQLAGVSPEVVAVDAHPGYLSRRLGRELAAGWSVPVVEVQHHHAHLASVIADAARPTPGRTRSGPVPEVVPEVVPEIVPEIVLGVVFDGTGAGTDGTVWGGELLVTDDGGRRVRRIGHLRATPLPGGDAAVEHPARTALAHLHAAGIAWDDRLPSVRAVGADDRRVLTELLSSRGPLAVASSSMGRLIDAVASLVGIRHDVTYEAHAAIELEALADLDAPGAYRFGTGGGSIDPSPVLRAVVDEVLAGTPASTVSMRFHRAIIDLVIAEARRWWSTADETGSTPGGSGRGRAAVALSGGVFQNRILLEGCLAGLHRANIEVLTHERVPTNDGGLALGQVVAAGGI